MAAIYSDIPESSVEIEVSEEIIEQDFGTGQASESVQEEEVVEIEEESIVPSTDSSYEHEAFSIAKFLGRVSINLILPFINGLMLGFGEIIAHEIGFHYNWTGSRVSK